MAPGAVMAKEKQTTEYSEAEAQARFEKTLRTALNTPPKPLKDLRGKRQAKQKSPTGNPPGSKS